MTDTPGFAVMPRADAATLIAAVRLGVDRDEVVAIASPSPLASEARASGTVDGGARGGARYCEQGAGRGGEPGDGAGAARRPHRAPSPTSATSGCDAFSLLSSARPVAALAPALCVNASPGETAEPHLRRELMRFDHAARQTRCPQREGAGGPTLHVRASAIVKFNNINLLTVLFLDLSRLAPGSPRRRHANDGGRVSAASFSSPPEKGKRRATMSPAILVSNSRSARWRAP